MSYNDQKIVKILLQKSEQIDERYKGYRESAKELVADVLMLERENSIRKIPIVQKIQDKVSASGQLLYRKTSSDGEG